MKRSLQNSSVMVPRLVSGPTPWVSAAILVLQVLLSSVQAPVQERSQYEATVSRVRIDVIVTDDGRFVEDLTVDDFLVYEDDSPQQVLTVELVDLGEGDIVAPRRAAEASQVTRHPRQVERDEPAGRDSGRGTNSSRVVAGETGFQRAADLGAVVYVVDGPSISPSMKDRFSQAWIDVLNEASAVNVPQAAFMITSFGRVEELVPMTLDIDRIRQAASSLKGRPLTQVSLADRLIQFRELMIGLSLVNSSTQDGGTNAGEGGVQAQAKEDEELSRSLYTIGLLESFCDALAARSGRTALIWVSGGVKLFDAGPFSVLGGGASPISLSKLDPRAAEKLEALQHAANTSNVSIYAIDPTPLGQVHGVGASAAIPPPSGSKSAQYQARPGAGPSGALNSEAIWQALDGLRDGLRQTAAETGGEAIIGATDLRQAIRTIAQDNSRFYLVTYAPPLPIGDGRYHDIQVEVKRPGLAVRARKGYVEHPLNVRLNRMATAALALPGTVAGFPLTAKAFRVWGWGSRTTLVLAAEMDSSLVQVGIREDGAIGSSLRIHVRVLDEDRELVASEDDDLSARSRQTLKEEPDSSQDLTVRYRRGWVLDPGTYDVHIAMLDEIGEQVGAVRMEVEVPAEEGGWRTSDLMLLSGISGLTSYPIASDSFRTGQEVRAYLEVKDGVRPFIRGQILLASSRSDEAPARDLDRRLLPHAQMEKKRIDTHSGSIALPSDLPPGEYVLEIVVTDHPAEEERIFRVSFDVLPSIAAG